MCVRALPSRVLGSGKLDSPNEQETAGGPAPGGSVRQPHRLGRRQRLGPYRWVLKFRRRPATQVRLVRLHLVLPLQAQHRQQLSPQLWLRAPLER